MKPGLFLSLIISISCICFTNAQTSRIYTSGSGLPSSLVNDIYQCSNGFIWISTENGLARFDGMDFSTFHYNRNYRKSLCNDFVLFMYEDNHGTFWVGTSSGLQIFDEAYNTFTKVDLKDSSLPSSDQHIADIIQVEYTGEERIVAATSGYGIYILDPTSREIDAKRQAELNGNLPSQFIRELYADSKGRLWIGTENDGITIIDLASGSPIRPDIKGIDGTITATSFIEDTKTGNMILGTSTHGVLIFDDDTKTIRRAKDSSAGKYSVESLLKNNILPQYGESTFLAGTENNGILIFDAMTEKLSCINFPNVSQNTSTWKVHSLMEDIQGNVWVGAYQSGVMVIPKSMYGFESVQFGLDENWDGACVTSVTEDSRNGDIWIGTDGKGLFRLGKDGRKSHYSKENSKLTNNSIMSIVQDKRGTLWIATYMGGIFKWEPQTGFRQFKDQAVLNTDKTSCLAYSPEEDILYVGTHGNGMSIVSLPEEKVIRTFAEDENKWVSNLFIDRTGMLWVGTYNGPMCYDHRIQELIRYEVNESLKIRVISFGETSDGKIWIGTGEGLFSFDRSTKNTVTYTTADGLPSNIINEIRESSDGSLWIATNKGLSRLDMSEDTFKNYYQYDGLQEDEFHARASYKAKDGKLYFGGIKGLTSFYPHIVDQCTHPVPPLYFSDLRIMNEPVIYDADNNNIIDKHITQATSIRVPYERNMVSLMFSVLEYTNPRKIVYDYMMEGFDDSWNHTGQESRTVTYTNLPPGKYNLAVKAYFDGEPAEFSYREIGIRILSPWYMTWWAILIYILIAILIALALVQRSKRIQLQKQEKEESEIKEMKLKMFTNISHEIRTPLTLVMSPLKKMRESEKDPKQKELYNLMYRNSLRILRMVNQLLDMRKVDSGQMKLHFLETDVVYFIKDIMKSFDNLAANNKIRMNLVSEEEVTNLWIDQGNFDKIIFNILSNAFKYTPENGSVSIHIGKAQKNEGILASSIKEYVEFIIENTGSRIDEKYLDKLFDRFFQTDIKDAKVGSGVGLNLAKMLVDLHHGDIKAYNTETGVAFAIRIPSGCSHLTQEEMTKPTNHKDLYTKRPAEDLAGNEDVTCAPAEMETAKQTKSKRNIVLVDDDSEMRAYLKLELQSIYNIEVCASGKDAWTKITTTIPDAIVTDLRMEGMDGAELCEKVKKNHQTNHIPVIILTSSSDENSQQKCIDSGADRFLTKPISLEILKSTISNAIATRDTIRNKYNKEIDYKLSEIQMKDPGNELVSKVIETIRKNMENTDFTVEDLSREVGMSRVHLNRKLKEVMNVSPSSLIRSIRLKQAAFLLINNNVNISEVAYKVGFSTHSYFSNSFHDYFGMTPKEFVAKYTNCKDEETLKRIFE